MDIPAVFQDGYWQPNGTLPKNFFEIAVTPAGGYRVVDEQDIISTSPTPSPSGYVTQVFSGSRTVSPLYFGQHNHLFPANGPVRCIYGSIRGHDIGSGTTQKRARWNTINTARGVYDWERLDQWVNAAVSNGLSMVYCLSSTPQWASARPSESGAYGNGTAAEPALMSDWTAWCTALATRYSSVIKHWEVWNEVNVPAFYSGTQAMLSQLTRLAKEAIRAVDPSAVIVAPNTTSLQTGTGISYWSAMMDASDGAAGTMKDHIDIVSTHLYPNWAVDVPLVPTMITNFQAAIASKGLSAKPIWNTEYGILRPLFYTQDPEVAKKQLTRLLVVPAAMGIARSFWYGVDVADSALKAPAGTGFSFDVQDHWNEVRRTLLSGPITTCNVCKDGRVGLIVNGTGYVF